MTTRQLHEKRGSLMREADLILQTAGREKRAVSNSEDIRLEKIKQGIFDVDSDLARARTEMRMLSNSQDHGGMNLEGYSLLRALNGAAGGNLSGFEAEVSQEISRRSGVNPSGFFVPNSALIERRGMSVTGSSGIYGGSAVQTDVGEDFLAALRPLSQVINAGATIFSGLTHSLAFPSQNAATTASWKSEVAALDEVTSDISQITLSPRRVGAFTELSNQLLIQTNSAVEKFVRMDLLTAIATAIDAAALAGAGSPAPTGVLGTSGIGEIVGGTNGSAPTWAHITGLVGKVADANADFGKLGFITNSKVLTKLRSTAKVASTDSKMILEGDSLLNYPVYGSNHVPSNLTKGSSSAICSAILFGNWEDVLIGQFGAGTDLIIDRFSKATTGITRVVANSFVDVGIRRAASFSAMRDALTA